MNTAARRTAAGRADLVRLLGMLPREQHAHAATALGFMRQKEPDPEIEISVVDDNVLDERNGTEGTTFGQEVVTAQPSDLRVPLLRFERMEFTDEPDTAKPRTGTLETVTSDDLRSPGRSLFATPRPESLTPWSRLWPKLRDSLQSSLPSHELDVDSYVRDISRGETLREVPRKTRRVWAGRFSVWIDRSSRLVPFWSDQMDVWQRLRKLCDKSGITRRLLDARMQLRSIRRRCDLLDGFSSATDTPILVLGDLGMYGSDADRVAWKRTGKRLQRCGSRLTALVPGALTRFSPFMTRTWNAQAWERGRIRGKPEEGWTERRDRLTKMVSPVALLQPGLLRAIRRLLPAALADASTEADVWNHEDVQVADATGWLLQSEALLKWREAFAVDASLGPHRQNLSETIRAWHENVPREILRGDTLIWHALVPDAAPPGDLQDAVAFAKRLEATALAGGADAKVAEALLSFQKRLLATMPAAIYEKVPALATVWVASFEEGEVPPGVDVRAIRGRLEEPGEIQYWAVRQVGSDLEFFLNDRGPAWASHVEGPGSPVAWLEATRPWLYVERAGRVVQMRLENGLSLPWEPGERIELRTDRCIVTLTSWYSQDEPGWVAAGRDRFGLWADAKIRGVVQRFRWIPPGKSLMGSPKNEAGRFDNEGPQQEVTWTEGRWLGDTPVTQVLWKAVMGKNPSYFQDKKDLMGERPVEQVSWNHCRVFAEKFSLRLPLEAEWEHACRAGTTTATWAGDLIFKSDIDNWYFDSSQGGWRKVSARLDDIAWYDGNMTKETNPVRQKEPNPLGLFDMLGNVYEWCIDTIGIHSEEAVSDPQAFDNDGTYRILRGGSWASDRSTIRAAHRNASAPDDRNCIIGFRLARDAVADDLKKRGTR